MTNAINYDDALNQIIYAEATLATSLSTGATRQVGVYELFSEERFKIPFHVRTGAQSMGSPSEKKIFHFAEFHGRPGTFRVRIYIDGRYVCDGRVVLSESSNRHRRVNIPLGKRVGYSIDVEFVGDAAFTAIEFGFDPYSGDK